MVDDFLFSGKDRLFLGEALFETLAVRQSKPCFPELHWQRLNAGIERLGLSVRVSEHDFFQAIECYIHQHQLKDCGLKLILSFGEASRGLSAYGRQPAFYLHSFDLPALKPRVSLIKNEWLRDGKNPVYQLKSISYLENILARRKAEAMGADDALFFNLNQQVTETCTANIFIIKNAVIITPPEQDGLLAGTTRHRLIQMALQQGIEIVQQSLTEQQLLDAEALFLSSSLQGLQQVTRYEQRDYPENHPLFLRLQSFLSSSSAC